MAPGKEVSKICQSFYEHSFGWNDPSGLYQGKEPLVQPQFPNQQGEPLQEYIAQPTVDNQKRYLELCQQAFSDHPNKKWSPKIIEKLRTTIPKNIPIVISSPEIRADVPYFSNGGVLYFHQTGGFDNSVESTFIIDHEIGHLILEKKLLFYFCPQDKKAALVDFYERSYSGQDIYFEDQEMEMQIWKGIIRSGITDKEELAIFDQAFDTTFGIIYEDPLYLKTISLLSEVIQSVSDKNHASLPTMLKGNAYYYGSDFTKKMSPPLRSKLFETKTDLRWIYPSECLLAAMIEEAGLWDELAARRDFDPETVKKYVDKEGKEFFRIMIRAIGKKIQEMKSMESTYRLGHQPYASSRDADYDCTRP